MMIAKNVNIKTKICCSENSLRSVELEYQFICCLGSAQVIRWFLYLWSRCERGLLIQIQIGVLTDDQSFVFNFWDFAWIVIPTFVMSVQIWFWLVYELLFVSWTLNWVDISALDVLWSFSFALESELWGSSVSDHWGDFVVFGVIIDVVWVLNHM
jgi:hypothetical protein